MWSKVVPVGRVNITPRPPFIERWKEKNVVHFGRAIMVARVLYIVYVLRCPRQWSQRYPMCVRGLTSASLKSHPTFKASNALFIFMPNSVSNSYFFTKTVFLLINKFMQNALAPRYPSIHLTHKLDSSLWLTLEGLLFFTLNYTYTASFTCPVFQSIYIRTLLWTYRVFLFFSILFFFCLVSRWASLPPRFLLGLMVLYWQTKARSSLSAWSLSRRFQSI